MDTPSAVEFSSTGRSTQIRWDGVFLSAPLEEAFRQEQAIDDLPIARACILVGAVGTIAFVAQDVRVLQPGLHLGGVLAARVVMVAFSLVLWVGLKKWPVRVADRMLVAWCFALGSLCLYLTVDRPEGFVGPIIINLFTVLVAYSVLPLPLARQCMPALLLTVGSILIALWNDGVGITATAAVSALAMANVLGAVPSWRLNHRRRLAFLVALSEAQSRARLEQALAEVRTLRGMISICAWCKRIRDKEAVWHQIEMYVQHHTHAEFTHGICPSCIEAQIGARRAALAGDSGIR